MHTETIAAIRAGRYVSTADLIALADAYEVAERALLDTERDAHRLAVLAAEIEDRIEGLR